MRWRLDLEYDGAPFEGWQLQEGARTVQGEVEQGLARLLGHPVRVKAAGRTDAGVHARQQVVVVDTTVERDQEAFLRGLSSLLRPHVAVVAARRVADDFEPRHHPHRKTYRYRWLCREAPSPLRAGFTWFVRGGLDAGLMAAAARTLEGTHDFSSFRAQGCSAKHPVRTLERLWVEAVEDEVHLVAEGTGFLRHMVRILAGTLTDIGQRRQPEGWLWEVLQARDRSRAGRTAPAHGLSLERIVYDPEP